MQYCNNTNIEISHELKALLKKERKKELKKEQQQQKNKRIHEMRIEKVQSPYFKCRHLLYIIYTVIMINFLKY